MGWHYPKPGPLLIVLSGPSGVGKDAVLSEMKRRGLPLHYTVTVTTRPRREGEREGVDYYFVSPREFQGMVERGELLEWANVYGHLYGVPRLQVEKALAAQKDVIVKADVQGAATIKALQPKAVFIFLAPPSPEELEERLRQRKTESPGDFRQRLETARIEMEHLPRFDYLVFNYQDRVDLSVAQIEAIIIAEKHRTRPRVVKL